MPACRLPVHRPFILCLCAVALGCVTEQSRKDGSFTTGGPGAYGQPAPGVAAKPKLTANAKNTDSDYKPSQRLQLALAQFQEQRGFRDEARKSYEQVLAADAKSTDAIIGLARLDQLAGRSADAEAGFQKAIQMDPHSGRALDALGQYYAEQKRWNEALPLLQRAQAAAPDDKAIRFHYGVTLAKVGQIDQAVPLLVEAVGRGAAHYNIGLILHERGELAASEEQFVAAIVENPRLQQAQFWLNQVRREQDQTQHAAASETTGEVAARGRRPTLSHASGTAPQQLLELIPARGALAGAAPAAAQLETPRGAAGETAQSDAIRRQPAGHSAGPSDFAPSSQLTAPVSPLALSPSTRREAAVQNVAGEQAEQWNNQR